MRFCCYHLIFVHDSIVPGKEIKPVLASRSIESVKLNFLLYLGLFGVYAGSVLLEIAVNYDSVTTAAFVGIDRVLTYRTKQS